MIGGKIEVSGGMCISVLLVFDEFELRADKQVAKCLVVLLEYGKLRRRAERFWESVLWQRQVSCDEYAVCFQDDRFPVVSSVQLKAGVSCSVTMGLKILMYLLFRTLDKAMYSIPLGTVGQSNQTINFLMFVPRVLQMVME